MNHSFTKITICFTISPPSPGGLPPKMGNIWVVKRQKSRKLCGIAGAGSDQRIHVQDDVLAVRSKPPPTADEQFRPALPYRKVREDCRLGKPIGPEFLHVLGAIVPLIKVNKEFARIHDILLALHPNQIEEVQQTFRKKKADEVLVKLELCGYPYPYLQRYNLSLTVPRRIYF